MKTAQASYREICDDQQGIDELVQRELPHVHYVAARISERLPHYIDMQDLIQAGIVGLLEAFRTYDQNKDAQFSTFARFRIRGAILDSLRRLDWGSRAIRRKGREIQAAETRLEGVLGRQPSEEEIAKEVNVSLAELQSLRSEIDSLYLLGQQADSPFEGGKVRDLIENAPASDKENPFEICAEGERRKMLVKAVSELDEKEQTILSLYYHEEMTMKNIAEILGCTQSRVSQIHSLAMAKLRRKLTSLIAGGNGTQPIHPSIPDPRPEIRTRRPNECIA